MVKEIILGILISVNVSIAYCDESNMTDTAINARDMKSKFYPKIQVPFTYNYYGIYIYNKPINT